MYYTLAGDYGFTSFYILGLYACLTTLFVHLYFSSRYPERSWFGDFIVGSIGIIALVVLGPVAAAVILGGL